MKKTALSALASYSKVLLGAFFLFSAFTKFVDIEQLYIYIYSFNLVSLPLSVVAGWLLVSFELLLGVAFVTNRHHRVASVANLLLLLAFTLFLAFAMWSGRGDSCNCLGEMLPFTPGQSIVKNAVLILLSLFVWRYADANALPRWWLSLVALLVPYAIIVAVALFGSFRMNYYEFQYLSVLAGCMFVVALLLSFSFWKRWYIQLAVVLTPVVAVLVLSAWVNLFQSTEDLPYNAPMLQRVTAPGGQLHEAEILQGRKVVAFYSTSCQYCQEASRKLSVIQQRNQLPQDAFVTVFAGSDSVDVSSFYQDEYVNRYKEYNLCVDTFLHLTYGSFPLVLMLDNGEVKATFSQSSLSERQISDFLQTI